tara:strand:+ start:5698 stop:6045 length:348 start_codon:yes stop_codon:yes gene_type:complete
MSHAIARALTLAATHFVDCRLEDFDADEIYPHLQELSGRGDFVLAGDVTDFSICCDYQHMTLEELLMRIEVSANQMVEFGKLMLDAAHKGLMEVIDDPAFDPYSLDLSEIAEASI